MGLIRVAEANCLDLEERPSTRALTLLAMLDLPGNSTGKKKLELVSRADEILAAEDPKAKARIEVLVEKSDALYQRGDSSAALSALEAAVELKEELFGRRSPEYVEGRAWIVNHYLGESQSGERRANLERARFEAEELIAEAKGFLAANDPVMFGLWATYVAVLRELGESEEADELEERYLTP